MPFPKEKPDLGTGRALLDGSTDLGTLADDLKRRHNPYRSVKDWNSEPIEMFCLRAGPSRSSTTTLW
jgi:hypothetical protein